MMQNTVISKIRLLIIGIIFFTAGIFLILLQSGNKFTFITFCDVGQGDSIYIRTKDNIDILIDTGPSGAVLTCLGENMPFFDRKIEYVFISHPQTDHYGSLSLIVDRYRVEHLLISPLYSDSKKYKTAINKAKSKGVNIIAGYSGQRIAVNPDASVNIIWPTENFVIAKTLDQKVLGATTLSRSNDDPNDFSQVLLFKQDNFDLLLTGDISAQYLERILEENKSIGQIEIIKVPHHGSATGLNDNILNVLDPDLAVISVGNNSYGHPSKKLTDMLDRHNINYLTTKQSGAINITVKDGGWQYQTEK